jgi:hypothetical protein
MRIADLGRTLANCFDKSRSDGINEIRSRRTSEGKSNRLKIEQIAVYDLGPAHRGECVSHHVYVRGF